MLSSTDVLTLINREYSLGEAHHCKYLRRGFNDTYLIGIADQWYIFRVYLNHKYYIETPDAFQFEVDLLEHLHNAGIPVAPALRRKNNQLLGQTTTHQGERTYALFVYAEGDTPSNHTLTSEHLFQLGQTIAKFHLVANDFSSPHKRYHLDRKYLVDEPLRIIAEQHDQKTRVTSKEEVAEIDAIIAGLQPIEDLIDRINALDVSDDEYGIIHSDLHPGNIHLKGDQFTFFDFDHCAYGWRAYELAITEFMPEPHKNDILKGYESVRPLSGDERNCIPLFAKLRQLWDIGDALAIKPVRAQHPPD